MQYFTTTARAPNLLKTSLGQDSIDWGEGKRSFPGDVSHAANNERGYKK